MEKQIVTLITDFKNHADIVYLLVNPDISDDKLIRIYGDSNAVDHTIIRKDIEDIPIQFITVKVN